MRAAAWVCVLAIIGCEVSGETATESKLPTPAQQPPTRAQKEAKMNAEQKPSVKPVTSEMLENLHPWRNISDAQLAAELDAAYALAKEQDKRVLLDFVASWCHDCVEVLKVAQQAPASTVISERYVYIPINVGNFDRAEALRKKYDIKKIATLVVLDADGTRVAQSTLEPISKKQKLTPEALAAWLKAPADLNPRDPR